MEIALFFDPVTPTNIPANKHSLSQFVDIYTEESGFPDLDGVQIAFIGVKEDRGAINNAGCCDAPDDIRKFLYQLHAGPWNCRIADLGNIKKGHDIRDTYFALTSSMEELLRKNILPVIIGGSHDLSYAMYKAYEALSQIVNITAIDNSFDLGEEETEINARSYLSKIILTRPNFLFNYTNIGYQTYFVDQSAISLMRKLFFDTVRLGIAQSSLEDVEPLIRNADMVMLDISAIRMSDAPGNMNATPNGFYGEEACQMARYAGFSDKLTSVGFFEANPVYDNCGQTAHLTAQMIWYFVDGFASRINEFPGKVVDDFFKYHVSVNDHEQPIIFYKSKKSERWWMEVNCPENVREKYERHYIVPCSFADYQTACSDEVPDRWWQAYQKMM
ncbi:MAG: formimidoylglutamase [Bacteroidota bacterium]|nr:formimidoylglutamase [Bacteroidota bacterium]